MKKKVSERFIDAIVNGMDGGYPWEYEHKFKMAEEPFLKRFWVVFVYKLSDAIGIVDALSKVVSTMIGWVVIRVAYSGCFAAASLFAFPAILYAIYKGTRDAFIGWSIRRNPRYKALKTRYLETTKKVKDEK